MILISLIQQSKDVLCPKGCGKIINEAYTWCHDQYWHTVSYGDSEHWKMGINQVWTRNRWLVTFVDWNIEANAHYKITCTVSSKWMIQQQPAYCSCLWIASVWLWSSRMWHVFPQDIAIKEASRGSRRMYCHFLLGYMLGCLILFHTIISVYLVLMKDAMKWFHELVCKHTWGEFIIQNPFNVRMKVAIVRMAQKQRFAKHL